MKKVSSLLSCDFPDMFPVFGVRMATAEAGIKYRDRKDLLFLIFDRLADVAGVFTRSLCPSAPVDHCRSILSHGKVQGIVVNSGNANAFTGNRGKETTVLVSKAAADVLECRTDEIYIASTGVIGESLDANLLIPHLSVLAQKAEADRWFDAAQAIMTTDTFPKGATRRVLLDGREVTINGIAKGSGMIAPDMATMLCFVVTDASVDSTLLQQMLQEGVRNSFNCITVDSDMSTSDTLLLVATGHLEEKGVNRICTHTDPGYSVLSEALGDLLHELSLKIVRDGEGARKLIEVHVTGAVSDMSARRIARSVADSPLVKTAVAGEDANWGRVVMAVGKAGEVADRDRLAIWFGPYRVAFNGERDVDYSEQLLSQYMKENEICIRTDIGMGRGEARMWTCDLTKEYVAINGDYRS